MTAAQDIARVLALPQVDQQTDLWHTRRRNKQSASDFGAVVPRTPHYIQHIVDRWQSEDLSSKRKSSHCYTYGPDAYYLQKVFPFNADPIKVNGVVATRGACARGHQFETVIRHMTSQHLALSIVEMGWVEGQHTPHAGVSPDGLVLDDVDNVNEAQRPHWYSFHSGDTADDTRHNPLFQPGFAVAGPKNFEAKTVVSRAMLEQVPLKYHIQVERTAYELGLLSSIYAEAKFTILHKDTWKVSAKAIDPEIEHMQYGIMVSTANGYLYAPHHVKTPDAFETWQTNTEGTPIYFRVDAFWCVEIPLWENYKEVYGPLIIQEAEKLNWMATTPDGLEEYNRLRAAKMNKPARQREKKCDVNEDDLVDQLTRQKALE